MTCLRKKKEEGGEGGGGKRHEEPQAMIFLHGIWRHIKEFGIKGQIPRIPSPVKPERGCLKISGS